MNESDGRSSGDAQMSNDDTAAFQRFYSSAPQPQTQKGIVYRMFIGWWRDRG